MQKDIAILIIETIRIFAQILKTVLFARVILSWLPISRDNVFINFIYNFTEPLLSPIRDIINKSPIGGTFLDFSVIILFLLVDIVANVLTKLILVIFY